jgi:hypothetical protein
MTIERETFEIEVEGARKPIRVTVAGDSFRPLRARHRSQDISATTIAELRKKVEDIEAEHQAEKAAKAARQEPSRTVSACVWDSKLGAREVEARGYDGRTRADSVLVTYLDDGGRGSVELRDLLRPLTQDERARLAAAGAEAVAAQKDYVQPLTPWTARSRGPWRVELSVSLDHERDEWVTTWEGREIRAANPRDLQTGVEETLVAREFPFAVFTTGGEDEDDEPRGYAVDRYTRGDKAEYVFRTREEAERWVASQARQKAADRALRALLASLRFDPERLRAGLYGEG